MDTIFALASGVGRAGVSVIRVSGTAVEQACRAFGFDVPDSHRAVLRSFETGLGFIDQGLVLHFAENRSFTGEQVVEFHLHGSPAVVKAVLAELSRITDCRPAEPGEFTRRALDGGRMSLTEVEGLSDLLVAETEAQRVQASRLFQGELARTGELWRARLLGIVAHVEALIDFSEEDLGDGVEAGLQKKVNDLRTDIEAELRRSSGAERVSDGFEVALVGEPNVGKSTLLNFIARREAALTSDVAGTTRDIIEVRYDLKGLPVTFLDTAGVRTSDNQVESLGISRTVERAQAADIRVFIGNVPNPFRPTAADLQVAGKADLTRADSGPAVSGVTGQGVDQLLESVHEILRQRMPSSALVVQARHRMSLETSVRDLCAAEVSLLSGVGLELVAESLRSSLRAMEQMLGHVGVEDILGEIFGSFCIGK